MSLITEHRIEDGKQFPHAGDDRYFAWFPLFLKSPVEAVHDLVVAANGRQRSHVEHLPDFGSSTPDSPGTSVVAAVPIEWRHPHQCCNLLAVQEAQLWQ